MSSMMDLSSELLEEIFFKLKNPEDVISLGSSCRRLATIVGQTSFWRIFFSKIELVRRRFFEDRVMRERVRTLTTFLATLEDSYAIFCLLHQMIYQRYPATPPHYAVQDRITVSFPSSPELHSVSGLGLQLLALIGRENARH